MAAEARPLYCVYRAGDRPVACYRGVSQNPAQIADFLTFADLDIRVDWWDMHRATGVSAWTDEEKARTIAHSKRLVWIARLDLGQADERTPWAFTGRRDHVTIWAPALVLIPAVVNYGR